MYFYLNLINIINLSYIWSFFINGVLSYRINNQKVPYVTNTFGKESNTCLREFKRIRLKHLSSLNTNTNVSLSDFKDFSDESYRPAHLNDRVRVRFAPSPTGLLHIGSLRTYIYNYMFAKKNKGKLLLRIDDTDEVRNVSGSLDEIVSSLQWTGLDWDEGVYKSGGSDSFFQSKRHHLYREYAEMLVQSKHAYRCFCKESLFKKFLQKLFNYQPKTKCDQCYNLSSEENMDRLKTNNKYSIKLRSNTREFDDFVIVRSNGTATYNFSSCVDDHLMRITHVIRGSEHTNNTNKQNLIFDFMKAKRPEFIHVPLILDEDKGKISKRSTDQNFTVKNLRLDGICPLALVNYLTFLGTKYSDEKDVYEIEELVNKFSFDLLSNLPISFDYKKLLHLNRRYISNSSERTLKKELNQYLNFYLDHKKDRDIREREKAEGQDLVEQDLRLLLDELVEIFKPRISSLKDYFVNVKQSLKYNYENIKAKPKKEYDDQFKRWMDHELKTLFETSNNSIDLQINFLKLLKETSSLLHTKEYLKSLRFLLTGETKGPALVDMAKTWKVAQDYSFPGFVTLDQRLRNMEEILA